VPTMNTVREHYIYIYMGISLSLSLSFWKYILNASSVVSI
jgi:hypothetical protein